MERLVHDYLYNNLEKNENNILIKEKDHYYTHGEIERLSNRFANYLLALGVKRHNRICLVMDSTVNALIAILGIMKMGAIFVPIFVQTSSQKVCEIYHQVEAVMLIVDSQFYYSEYTELTDILVVHGDNSMTSGRSFEEYIQADDCFIRKYPIISRDLLYIMFTSGTTGVPKGVMITHENVCTFMDDVVSRFHHNESTCTLSKSPLSFDPYLTEIVPSFISGGKIVLYPNMVSIRHFLKTLQEERITNFGCGPSLLQLMVKNRSLVSQYDLSSMKEIYFGYENCPLSVIRTLQEELPNILFINGYGTTETYASSTFHIVENLTNLEVYDLPIGEPIAGTELLVIDEYGQEAREEEIGELVIRGTSLMNGYWRDEEETRRVLRPHPLFPESNEKVYYTGDLVRRDGSGEIIYVSRKDEQVKISGYRVEPAEVQKYIEDIPLVEECTVIAIDHEETKQLVCFYRLKQDKKENLDQLKQICARGLESYKFPQEWIPVSELPRNKNTKIDKRALARLYVEMKDVL